MRHLTPNESCTSYVHTWMKLNNDLTPRSEPCVFGGFEGHGQTHVAHWNKYQDANVHSGFRVSRLSSKIRGGTTSISIRGRSRDPRADTEGNISFMSVYFKRTKMPKLSRNIFK
ncbi:hypothetical protein GN244_ATG13877 [Phytophthora infestans]|uniref:Uncharacterized protein n=1 Tax=Phytophthora infestans TaxID=4787 RepID=A0A833VYL8_PHYIN|nr:hypothetical protein GN244_ATG13877 [Phytophthora infestans]